MHACIATSPFYHTPGCAQMTDGVMHGAHGMKFAMNLHYVVHMASLSPETASAVDKLQAISAMKVHRHNPRIVVQINTVQCYIER